MVGSGDRGLFWVQSNVPKTYPKSPGSTRQNKDSSIFLNSLSVYGQTLGLVAGGVSVHFLQKLAHCIELRAEAFPISGLQSLHCLIVAIKRLPCLTCRWACHGHLLRRA